MKFIQYTLYYENLKVYDVTVLLSEIDVVFTVNPEWRRMTGDVERYQDVRVILCMTLQGLYSSKGIALHTHHDSTFQ